MTTITIDGKEYAIVPVELTEEMEYAGNRVADNAATKLNGQYIHDCQIATDVWLAILAYAPPVSLEGINQWRTIDSAPRDMTEIQVYWLDDREWHGEKLSDPHCQDVVCWQGKNFPPTEFGWFDPEHGGDKEFERFPTHWKNLDKPPERNAT